MWSVPGIEGIILCCSSSQEEAEKEGFLGEVGWRRIGGGREGERGSKEKESKHTS